MKYNPDDIPVIVHHRNTLSISQKKTADKGGLSIESVNSIRSVEQTIQEQRYKNSETSKGKLRIV